MSIGTALLVPFLVSRNITRSGRNVNVVVGRRDVKKIKLVGCVDGVADSVGAQAFQSFAGAAHGVGGERHDLRRNSADVTGQKPMKLSCLAELRADHESAEQHGASDTQDPRSQALTACYLLEDGFDVGWLGAGHIVVHGGVWDEVANADYGYKSPVSISSSRRTMLSMR